MGQVKSLPPVDKGLTPKAFNLLLTTKRYEQCLTNATKQYKRTKTALKRLCGEKSSEKKLFEQICRLCEGCWAEFDHEDTTTKIAGFALAMNTRMELVDRMYIEYVYKQIGTSIKELNKLNNKIKTKVNKTLAPFKDTPYQTKTMELDFATETSLHLWREQQCLNTDRVQLILAAYSRFQTGRMKIHQMCIDYLLEATEFKVLSSQSTDFADFARDAKKNVDQAIEKLLLQTEYGNSSNSSADDSAARCTTQSFPTSMSNPQDYLKQPRSISSIQERTALVPKQYY